MRNASSHTSQRLDELPPDHGRRTEGRLNRTRRLGGAYRPRSGGTASWPTEGIGLPASTPWSIGPSRGHVPGLDNNEVRRLENETSQGTWRPRLDTFTLRRNVPCLRRSRSHSGRKTVDSSRGQSRTGRPGRYILPLGSFMRKIDRSTARCGLRCGGYATAA